MVLQGCRWENKWKYLLNPTKETHLKPVHCLHKGSKVFQLSIFTRKRDLLSHQSPERHFVSLCFRALPKGHDIIL